MILIVNLSRNTESEFGSGLLAKPGNIPSIGKIIATNISDTTATISWTTDIDASTQVSYQLSVKSPWVTPDTTKIPFSQQHEVSLSGLMPSTTYLYIVKSCTTTNPVREETCQSSIPPLTFVTLPDATGDTARTTQGLPATKSPIWNSTSNLDRIRPVTTFLPATGTWTNTTVSRTLTCTNNFFGCLATYWQFVPVGTPCPLVLPGYTLGTVATQSAEGSWRLCAFSEDNQFFAEIPKYTEPFNIDVTPPAVPTPLSGTQGVSTVNLNWPASLDTLSGLDLYSVYKNNTPLATTTSTNYLAQGLFGSGNVNFFVKAKDIAGNTSAGSNTQNYIFTCPNAVSTPADAREMFVWEYVSDIITPGTVRQNDLFAFTDAKKVQTIYLNANIGDLQNAAFANNLRTFLNTARDQHCLSVELLSGAPNWLAYPNNGYVIDPSGTHYTSESTDWIAAAITFYNSITGTNAKPSGIHADIEPHGFNATDYPGFDHYWNWNDGADNMFTVQAYLGMIQNMKNAVGASGVILTLDIPRWLDTAFILQNVTYNAQTKNLMKHVLDIMDNVGIFDYVVNSGPCTPPLYQSGSECDDASGEFNYAQTLTNKHIKIIVEAGDVTGQGSTNGVHSFWTLACPDLNGALTNTYSALSTMGYLPIFNGFGVDPYFEDNRINGFPMSGFNMVCP